MLNLKNTFKYFLLVVISGFITFLFHEMGHWLSYELLGYKAGFTLNTSNIKDTSLTLSKYEKLISDAAGPIITIIQALVVFYWLKNKNNFFIYPLLFIPFVMRLAAGFANIIQANDEGRISTTLGFPIYIIPIMIIFLLLFLVLKTSKRNQYTLKDNTITFFFSLITIILIVFLDNKFDIQII